MAKSSEYVKSYRERMAAEGLTKVELYVPDDVKLRLKEIEPALQAGAQLAVMPPKRLTDKLIKRKGTAFMTSVEAWSVERLFDQLKADDRLDDRDIGVELASGASKVIEISYDGLDQKAVLAVEGEQILVSIPLIERSAVPNPSEMDRQMLHGQKVLPLSTVGLTFIGGHEVYDLHGALSARSLLDSIIEEIIQLERNYETVLEAITSEEDEAA